MQGSCAVAGFERRFGIEGAVVDECLSPAKKTAVVWEWPQPDDLADASIGQYTGQDRWLSGAACEVADRSSRGDAVGTAQDDVCCGQEATDFVRVVDEVVAVWDDRGVGTLVREMLTERIDLPRGFRTA